LSEEEEEEGNIFRKLRNLWFSSGYLTLNICSVTKIRTQSI